MAPTEKQKSYIEEFLGQLLPQSPDLESEDVARQQKKVLEDLLAQSLLDLEKRFSLYWQKLGSESDTDKPRDVISRSEKRLNIKMYYKEDQDRKPEIRHIHREALRNCYSQLTNDLHLFESSLMDDLLASDVVSVSDKESIRGGGTRKRQNEEFYSYLVGRLTFAEFHNTFLPALSKDHKHLADALITELDRLEEEYQDSQCVPCRARKHVQLKRLATPLLMQKHIDLPLFTDLRSPGLSNNLKWAELRHAASDANIINAMEKKYPDFHQEFLMQDLKSLDCCCPTQDVAEAPDVLPFERLMSEQESSSGFETCYSGFSQVGDVYDITEALSFQAEDLEQDYRMTSTPRGLCLIINNSKFPDSYHGTRFGSEVDVQKLTATFTRLQFEVVAKRDLSANKIMRTFKEYANMDHSNFDAFVCAILTHGDQDGLICPGRGHVKVQDLTSLFQATRCPSLAGKPKIFIIQASRGDSFMDGHKIDGSSETIADEADFLIGFSAVNGYASFRNIKSGSHYINALTGVLDSHADQHDLLTCMSLANREVSRLNMQIKSEYVSGRKQVPAPLFTLTKKVHFTSDPMWPYSAGTG